MTISTIECEFRCDERAGHEQCRRIDPERAREWPEWRCFIESRLAPSGAQAGLNIPAAQLLHESLMKARGHHSGILVVRTDNDASRDLKPPGIVRAIRNFENACIDPVDQYVILNQWR
jgi:hypothetical protein